MDRNTPLYDTKLSDLERSKYLLSQMTVEEKFTCFSLRIRNDRCCIPSDTGCPYTSFRYDGLKAEKAGGRLKVSLQVENMGRAAGDEVAQLYLRRISPSATGHPVRRLIGFERLHHLAPGEKRTACFTVNPCDLEIYLESEGKKIIEPGRYQLYAGGSCLDEQVCAEIDL